MLSVLKAQSKMREALREELLTYLSNEDICVETRWEVFTHEETQYILSETELGLSCTVLSTHLYDIDYHKISLYVEETYTYIEILEALLDYADRDFNTRVKVSKDVSDIDDLEYELKRLILSNGYYFVEV